MPDFNLKNILAGVSGFLPYAGVLSSGLSALGLKSASNAPELLTTLAEILGDLKEAADKRQIMADTTDLAEIERLLAEIETANLARAQAVDES